MATLLGIASPVRPMTQAEIDALNAERAALIAARSKVLLYPKSASNAMGSVAQRDIADFDKRIGEIDTKLSTATGGPPFGRTKLRLS